MEAFINNENHVLYPSITRVSSKNKKNSLKRWNLLLKLPIYRVLMTRMKSLYLTSITNNKIITKMEINMVEIESVKTKVVEHILSSSFNEKSKIEEDTMIFKEGILDSMGLMTLITFLEEEFGIATQDTDLVEENFETITAITNFVSQKLS